MTDETKPDVLIRVEPGCLGTNLDEMEEASMLAISNLIDRYLGHNYKGTSIFRKDRRVSIN